LIGYLEKAGKKESDYSLNSDSEEDIRLKEGLHTYLEEITKNELELNDIIRKMNKQSSFWVSNELYQMLKESKELEVNNMDNEKVEEMFGERIDLLIQNVKDFLHSLPQDSLLAHDRERYLKPFEQLKEDRGRALSERLVLAKETHKCFWRNLLGAFSIETKSTDIIGFFHELSCKPQLISEINWELVNYLYKHYSPEAKPSSNLNLFNTNIAAANFRVDFNGGKSVIVPIYIEGQDLLTINELGRTVQVYIIQLATGAVEMFGNLIKNRQSTKFSDLNINHSEKVVLGCIIKYKECLSKKIYLKFVEKFGEKEVDSVTAVEAMIIQLYSSRDLCPLCESFLSNGHSDIYCQLFYELKKYFPFLEDSDKDDCIFKKEVSYTIPAHRKDSRKYDNSLSNIGILTIDEEEKDFFNLAYLKRLLCYKDYKFLTEKRTYFSNSPPSETHHLTKSPFFELEHSIAQHLNHLT